MNINGFSFYGKDHFLSHLGNTVMRNIVHNGAFLSISLSCL